MKFVPECGTVEMDKGSRERRDLAKDRIPNAFFVAAALVKKKS